MDTQLAAVLAGMERVGDCWVWQGTLSDKGYGRVRLGGRVRATHRVIYEWLVGPIPEGLSIDHLCFNKACCNPAHLEAVTIGENVRRYHRARATCSRGHARHGLGRCSQCRRITRQVGQPRKHKHIVLVHTEAEALALIGPLRAEA